MAQPLDRSNWRISMFRVKEASGQTASVCAVKQASAELTQWYR